VEVRVLFGAPRRALRTRGSLPWLACASPIATVLAPDTAGRSDDHPAALCHRDAMRLHRRLIAELDRRFGRRRRSADMGQAIRSALDDERRWDDIEAALGAIPDTGHEWDDDPAAWVKLQRAGDPRRVG
jgi:hypothetical protein